MVDPAIWVRPTAMARSREATPVGLQSSTARSRSDRTQGVVDWDVASRDRQDAVPGWTAGDSLGNVALLIPVEVHGATWRLVRAADTNRAADSELGNVPVSDSKPTDPQRG